MLEWSASNQVFNLCFLFSDSLTNGPMTSGNRF